MDFIEQLTQKFRHEWRRDIQALAPADKTGVVQADNHDGTLSVVLQGSTTPVDLRYLASYNDAQQGHVVHISHLNGEPVVLDRYA